MTIDLPPLLGAMQFEEDELSKATQSPKRRYALGPIFVSVCLHALGLYVLVEQRIETPREFTAGSAAIQLQLASPPQVSPAKSLQTLPMEAANALESVITVPNPPAPTLPPPLVDLPQQPKTIVTIDPMPGPLPAPDSLAPTRLTVRQMVEVLRSEQEQQSVAQVCTPLQKRNPMLRCADEASAAFDSAQNDAGSPFLFATSGNTEASATRVGRIANSLRESGMSQSDIDRYLEGIDVNAQDENTSGDARTSAVIDQLFSNDSTYQLMKRVLNPW